MRVAVFASGTGRSFKNLMIMQYQQDLPYQIILLGVNKKLCAARQIALDFQIPSFYRGRKCSESREEFSEAYFSRCRSAKVDLVVLAGFLSKLVIPRDFENRVINIHPALIPKYSGPGFYGQRVHQAVLESGDNESGCTVHYCDNDYDSGPVIAQCRVDVSDADSAAEIARRVFAAECQLLPEVVANLALSKERLSWTNSSSINETDSETDN